MRVISGKHRGCVLYEFEGQAIRPTSDRAKEAVFNILQFKIADSECLDLFCGSGSLGIEAISRGARVTFVDNAKTSVELTKKNLAKVKELADVFCEDALSFLSRTRKKFDIIFVDPPYADDVSVKAVEKIIEKDLLNDDGVIVFERDRPCPNIKGAVIKDVRRYGKAVVSFIAKEKACLFAGSFDPITLGHLYVINKALEKYDRVYVTLMKNADKTSMFSDEERLKMLESALSDPRVTVDSWDGLLIDYMKGNRLVYNVRGIRDEKDLKYEKGMEEYNVANYPQIVYDYIYSDIPISSSIVRQSIKEGKDVSDYLSPEVLKYISKIQNNKT